MEGPLYIPESKPRILQRNKLRPRESCPKHMLTLQKNHKQNGFPHSQPTCVAPLKEGRATEGELQVDNEQAKGGPDEAPAKGEVKARTLLGAWLGGP